MEALLDKRVVGIKRRCRTEYLMRWKCWSEEYDQVVTLNELGNATRLLSEYDKGKTDSLRGYKNLKQSANVVDDN